MNLQECREVAEVAVKYPIDMLEFNASCPHTDFVAVENNPKLLRGIIKEIRSIVHPNQIAVKIAPNPFFAFLSIYHLRNIDYNAKSINRFYLLDYMN